MVMQSPPSVYPSVCLSVCFHFIFGTDWPLTLNFWMWVVHKHSSQGIEGQGHRSWLLVRLMRSVRPRSREFFFYSFKFCWILRSFYKRIPSTYCTVTVCLMTDWFTDCRNSRHSRSENLHRSWKCVDINFSNEENVKRDENKKKFVNITETQKT